MFPAEAAHLASADGTPFNVIPAHAKRLSGHVHEMPLLNTPYETFPAHVDVFGDGSIIVVPLVGHTPGSVGVFVNVEGRRIFNVGDAVNLRATVEELRGKGLSLARTDLDRSLADDVVAQLADLRAQVPSLEILPAHERSAWESVFRAPLQCVGPSR